MGAYNLWNLHPTPPTQTHVLYVYMMIYNAMAVIAPLTVGLHNIMGRGWFHIVFVHWLLFKRGPISSAANRQNLEWLKPKNWLCKYLKKVFLLLLSGFRQIRKNDITIDSSTNLCSRIRIPSRRTNPDTHSSDTSSSGCRFDRMPSSTKYLHNTTEKIIYRSFLWTLSN